MNKTIKDFSLTTGGARHRTVAEFQTMHGSGSHLVLYGAVGSGTMSHIFDAGGPIDAPERLPAGCMTCLCAADWQGRRLVVQAEAVRQLICYGCGLDVPSLDDLCDRCACEAADSWEAYSEAGMARARANTAATSADDVGFDDIPF